MAFHKEDVAYFSTSLTIDETRFIEQRLADLRGVKMSRSEPPRFSRIIGFIAAKRYFSILIPLDALVQYFRTLLRKGSPEQHSEMAEEAIDVLYSAMMRHRTTRQKINVVNCPMTAAPEERDSIVFNSPNDKAVVAGCDDQIGHLYNAKSNKSTIWIGEKFFSDASRVLPHNSPLDGTALCESFLSLILLHEFVHILLNEPSYAAKTTQLRQLYQAAEQLIPSDLSEKVVHGEDDETEFVVQAIAYENCRVDRFERRERFARE